jgi:NIPSNAP protein
MKKIVLACLAITALSVSAVSPQDAKNFFEVRVYTITPGTMDTFVKWMEAVTKWQESVGMQIAGQFAAPAQNRYVWIREYPDEATRLKRFEAVYGSGGMKQFGAPPGYEGGDVYLATATTSSHLQFASAARRPSAAPSSGSAIYEFRIYDVKAGTRDRFATYMSDRMIPWQERAYKVNVFAQLLPYAKVAGSARGGTVTAEDRTYIWGRVFANERDRLEKYKMYKDPAFQSVGAPADAGFEKVRIIILASPTSFSKLQ